MCLLATNLLYTKNSARVIIILCNFTVSNWNYQGESSNANVTQKQVVILGVKLVPSESMNAWVLEPPGRREIISDV